MTVVLAAVDHSAAALPVLLATGAMARTLGVEPRAMHVVEDEQETAGAVARFTGVPIEMIDGDPTDRIVDLSSADDVAMVVIGTRSHRAGHRPSGHVARAVMAQACKPVLAVPPDARLPQSDRFQHVLVPLEGTADSTTAVTATLVAFTAGGSDIAVLHVFRTGTVPRFWDQAGHAQQSWGTEFLAQWCDQPGAKLFLRSGDVADAILHVIAAGEVDLVVLGWSQTMDGEHARVVSEIVGRSVVPVLLVPAGG